MLLEKGNFGRALLSHNNQSSPVDKEMEEEVANYNGDEDNEGEFEADKQAELAQDWGNAHPNAHADTHSDGGTIIQASLSEFWTGLVAGLPLKLKTYKAQEI